MSVLSSIWSVQQPRYRQPGTLTIDDLGGGEAIATGAIAGPVEYSAAVRLDALARDETHARASESSLGKHSGMQVLHPPHEEILLMHAYVGSEVVRFSAV